MKIKPIRKAGEFVTCAFTVEVNDRDAIFLATLLSYARRAGFDNMHPSDQRSSERMLQRLAAACNAINCEADAFLQQLTPDYHKTMKLFDPTYEGR